MKTFDFKYHGHLPILFKNAPHSKVLEPVCLFYSYLLPIMTQPPGKRDRLSGSNQYVNPLNDFISFLIHRIYFENHS
jgi:hypothetical protein